MEERKIVVFQIGDKEYGMGITYLQGIEENQQIVPVANAPEFIEGIVNIRNEVIPVYNLHKKFSLSDKGNGESTKFLLLNIQGHRLACKVDQVNEMRECEKGNLFEFPQMLQTEETSYIDFVAKVNEKLILILKPENLLNKNEKGDVSDFIENLQKKE